MQRSLANQARFSSVGRRVSAKAPRTCAPRKSTVQCKAALDILQSAKKIDRLRYQAKLIFDAFDSDRDGKLSQSDVDFYFQYVDARLEPEKGAHLAALQELNTRELAKLKLQPTVGFDEFCDLLRTQVEIASKSAGFAQARLGKQYGPLQYASCLTNKELTAALVMHKLLDFDGDGKLKLAELELAQGIEKELVEDKLAEADADEDGLISFEEFLTSYHKERPVVLSMVLLASWCALYWLIFTLPLDIMFKSLMCMIFVLKPQLVTGPIMRVYSIIQTLNNRGRAELMTQGKTA